MNFDGILAILPEEKREQAVQLRNRLDNGFVRDRETKIQRCRDLIELKVFGHGNRKHIAERYADNVLNKPKEEYADFVSRFWNQVRDELSKGIYSFSNIFVRFSNIFIRFRTFLC